MKKAYRTHILEDFKSWVKDHPEEVTLWRPNLNMGHMKQFITDWIIKSVDDLRNPRFRETIKKCFQDAGCFREIRKNAATERMEQKQQRLESDIDGVVFDVEAMNLNLLKEDTFYDNDESIEEIDGQGDNDLEEKKKEDDNKEDEEDLPLEDD